MIRKPRQSKLTAEHIAFLTSQATLRTMAGCTLQERSTLFRRKFPNVKITRNILQRLYAKHKIRKKVVRMVKVPPVDKTDEYEKLRITARNRLQVAVDRKARIIFVDEVAFTKKTIQKRDYSNKYDNLKLNEFEVNTNYYTAVASITMTGTVQHVLINQGAINGKAYGRFLRQLRLKNGTVKIVIFQDNLNIHKTQDNKRLYEELNIEVIWNVPYSPEYNPIENVFSVVKAYYKKKRLNLIVNDKPVVERALIRESFAKVKPDDVKSFIRRCLYIIGVSLK